MRGGGIARERFEDGDLRGTLLSLALRGRGVDRSRAVAQTGQLALLRGDGILSAGELRRPLGETRVRVAQRCVDAEKLPVRLDLCVI